MKRINSKDRKTFEYLLRLLSSIICNTQPPKPNGDTDWASVFSFAEHHSVAGMTCYAVENLSQDSQPPKEIMDKFKQAQLSELVIESNIQLETEKLLKAFKNYNVSVVLLKGMVLKNYYPMANMRTMSDVDILYKESDKKDIIRIFKERGYSLNIDFNSELDFTKAPFHHYEMHSCLVQKDKSNFSVLSDVWENVDFNTYHNCGVLNLEYTYLYMLEHLAKHIQNAGAGLRMIMDVCLLRQKEKDNLNTKLISKKLDESGLLSFEKRISKLADNWFLSDNPDTESFAADFILHSSTFGLSKNSILQTNLRNERKTGKKQNGFNYLLRKIFPSYAHICGRFPSAKRLKVFYPFYIPAYWCLRLFRDKNINTSNLGHYFIKTDSDEAKYLLNVMDELGLSSRM